MALRRWRGVLAQENTQTGDGRVLSPGALDWAPLPLPLGWLTQEQHGDLLPGAHQIGTIDAIDRVGDDVTGAGTIDDAIPEGAELIRRLEAGSASGGNRVGLSIDPDNWAVELWDTTVQESEDAGVDPEEMLLLMASGSGPLVRRTSRSIAAAAGDPDNTDAGVLLMEDESGAWLERYTRLRIRGVTACAVAAFAGAYLELEPAEAGAEDATEPGTADSGAVVAAITAAAPVRPPAEWFALPEPQPGQTDRGEVYGMPVQELLVEQPDGSFGVPVTITEDGRVFGHAALWSTCHVGYLGECVTAPESQSGYAHFHVGSVSCADGSTVATGVLSANCDHAAAHLLAPEAMDHMAHTGLGFADVRATNGALGVWLSGALRPGITDEQVRVLRASSLSGDWRRIGTSLEFIGAIAVNVPGFPIAREHVTASGLSMPRASLAASAHVDNGQVMSLTASGVVQRCSDCAARQRAEGALRVGDVATPAEIVEALGLLRTLELRTRHLVPTAAEHALAVVKRGERIEPAMKAPARVLRPRKRD